MCGRYTLRSPLAEIVGAFSPVTVMAEWVDRPRYNVAPSQDVAVVRLNGRGDRVLGPVRWGLIPHWAKEIPKLQPINARSETAATGGMFRQAFQRRRCIVPSDGFYEWKREGKSKQPFYVRRADGGVFGFAGLWERWRDPSSDTEVDTVTVLTTTPNALMAPIHDRMPVILRPEDYGRWLDRSADPRSLVDLLRPHEGEGFTAHPVDPRVNKPAHDDESCIAPLTG